LERFVDALGARGQSVPILIGVAPLRDFEHAEFLHFEVPGVTIPDEVLARMQRAGSRSEETGRAIATELVWDAAALIQGVVVVPDEARSTDAAALLRGFLDVGDQRSAALSLQGGTTARSSHDDVSSGK
jgi:homocysteine S-methyltransferase